MLQHIAGIYPGDEWCKKTQAHSLWHAQSAAGLIDFFLLIDLIVISLNQ